MEYRVVGQVGYEAFDFGGSEREEERQTREKGEHLRLEGDILEFSVGEFYTGLFHTYLQMFFFFF